MLLPPAYREKLEAALGDSRRAAGQINGVIGGKPREPDPPPQHAPAYPPDTRRGLDQLIEQQQDH